jgi:wyosine [tRNA(Phe)-imidazoG37] synthetase (radical SAM superfamily)
VSEEPAQVRSSWAAVQDHSRQFADLTFVYPVISRRSRGLSIGVNLNPDKICNFDCVYCEVDRRTPPKVTKIDLGLVREELVAMIRLAREGGLAREPKFREVARLTRDIKDIAFSGEGEPTLVHNFAECVQLVADVKRSEHLDRTRIVLVTDAAGLDKADVRRGLKIMDANNGEIWAKLDAGTEEYFRKLNRSHVRFSRILSNLLATARLRPIIIQTMLLKLHGEPISTDELRAYCARLQEMLQHGARIKEVHAYTIARPAPETFATKLSKKELESLAAFIHRETGIPVLSFP